MWSTRASLFSIVLVASVAIVAGGCVGGERCRPGETRPCTLRYEGGIGQAGLQTCGADRFFAECVGEGVCRSDGGAVRAAYARCSTDDACGPSGCATCSAYNGVLNARGTQVCHPFCTTDVDCATDDPASGVSARCELGQCLLLCRASGVCPRDSQCLPWNDATLAARFATYDGLCD